MTVDFLIVGQGLAGSLLAWKLIQRHYKVLVIDNGKENASQIAAGLINPITGMRLVKSTDIDILLPVAKQTYQELETFFQSRFYIDKPMLRLFNSEKELSLALKKAHNSDYKNYLAEITQSTDFYNPFGLIEQKQTGYLLTKNLLTKLQEFLISQQSYQKGKLNYADIIFKSKVNWQGILAKKIIFCEGCQVSNNPWFSQLPFQPVKGEILTLRSEIQLPKIMLNYGYWFIPLEGQIFRTGATFDRQLDTFCTEQGKNNLLQSLHKVLPVSETAKILNHQANIRPCTVDKQPIIGQHPLYSQLLLFNGFGAKGSLQIPYYSQQFTNNLLNNTALSPQVDIARYRHFFINQ